MVIATVLAAGCGQSHAAPSPKATPTIAATIASTPTAIPNDLHGYLANDADSAIFIEWTDAGGNLAGTIQWAGPESKGSYAIKTQSGGFTGVRAGSRVTLTIPAGLGFSTTLSGTIDRSTLTLYMPNGQGITTPVTFHAATLTDHNRAVLALQQQALEQQAQAQSARATADTQRRAAQATTDVQRQIAQATALVRERQQTAVVNANAAVASALNRLSSDTTNLTARQNFDDVFRNYSDKWAKMQTDNQRLQSDAAKRPLTCVQLGRVQSDLGQLESDKGAIEAARGLFDARQSPIAAGIADVREDIRAVQSAFGELQAAVAANSTGSPPAQFSADDVDKAVSAANRALDAATGMLQQALGQADDFDGKATQLLKSAQDFVAGLKCTA